MSARDGSEAGESVAAAARRILEEIAANGVAPDADISSYVTVLSEYRSTCEGNGWYSEAELVHSVLKQVRREGEMRTLLQLDVEQQAQMRGLQEVHIVQFKQFNDDWNARLDAFDNEALSAERQMLTKHSLELGKFHAEIAGKPEARPRVRRDVIQLRAVEQKLARSKQYAEAARVKAQADALEASDGKTVSRSKEGTYARQESQMLARHRSELSALRTKTERDKASLERQRKEDLAQLLQKYKNVRRTLQGQQAVLKARTANFLAKHNGNENAAGTGKEAIASAVSTYAPPRK